MEPSLQVGQEAFCTNTFVIGVGIEVTVMIIGPLISKPVASRTEIS
jgi:hypothetical protein